MNKYKNLPTPVLEGVIETKFIIVPWALYDVCLSKEQRTAIFNIRCEAKEIWESISNE